MLSARRGIRGLIRSTSAVDNPPTGERALIPKTDGWYDRDSTGLETKLGASGGGETATGAFVDGGGPTTSHAGNLRVDFGSVT